MRRPVTARGRPLDPVERASTYPMLRYMGSKARLVPWLHEVFDQLDFTTALDAFSGSGCVAYLLKAMGKATTANDFLLFPSVIAHATVENARHRLTAGDVERLTAPARHRRRFVEETFADIFFTAADLSFLDTVWANLGLMTSPFKRSVALAALIRSCAKRQPRGVFTVGGPDRYLDGRRDLRLDLSEHFVEQVEVYNRVVFDSGQRCRATRGDILSCELPQFDLVYLDPPYVPRADDNCYVKRYHFLEGLASYWSEPDSQPLATSRVRKIPKRFTPFSYRRSALDAFDGLFRRFKDSTVVLSYGSNGFPDLDVLTGLMLRHKERVDVVSRDHRYHFGTHAAVSAQRSSVREYLVVGHGERTVGGGRRAQPGRGSTSSTSKPSRSSR